MSLISSRNTPAVMGAVTTLIAAARGIILISAIVLLITTLVIPQVIKHPYQNRSQGLMDLNRVKTICSSANRATNPAASITCELLNLNKDRVE